jgi:hypothetical protein
MNNVVKHTHKIRTKNEIQKSGNCICGVPCKCGKKYIGQTEIRPNTRSTKHKIVEVSKSKTAEHSWDEDHRIQRTKAEIIYKKENGITMTLKASESIRTKQIISQPSPDMISI